jgi:hypothetical protein
MTRSINLMPGSYRERLGNTRVRQRFLGLGLVAAIVIGVLAIHARSGMGRMRAMAQELTGRVAELEAVRGETREIDKRADDLAGKLSDYYRLALPIEVTDVLGLISRAIPDGLYVTNMNLSVSQRNESMSAMEELRQRVSRSKGRKSDDRRLVRYLSVDLTGLGEDGVQVAEFIGRLEAHSTFGRVQLDFDRTKVVTGATVREFRVRFEIDLENRFLAGAEPSREAPSDE